ncbi:hypothetical protein K457DRAFT_141776 [Linnemannia elongata AG-77]|uniref:F-box domain-containing protein n=1 Tax=Linnemannia elongata AG-77 TaxID=1314771 RepID=A0A197JI62_9FUNG|nr:hypothetical protein K457DRAFT_141776 [Linnemannia elongata AG-77]
MSTPTEVGQHPGSSFATSPEHNTLTIEKQPTVSAGNSLLASPPLELLELFNSYLSDPLDLLRFSYTCHEVFSHITLTGTFITGVGSHLKIINLSLKDGLETIGMDTNSFM